MMRVNKTASTEFGYQNKSELVGEDISLLIHSAIPEQRFEDHGEQRLITPKRVL